LKCDPANRCRGTIQVTKARIGCLDIQTGGNLTAIVAANCDGKVTCSYKAPNPVEYQSMGVRAATRSFCSQAMEITWRCSTNERDIKTVAGDAWAHPAAQLSCPPPSD
jgi:hypothetical protein